MHLILSYIIYRSRVFKLFRSPTILRTYQEPEKVNKRQRLKYIEMTTNRLAKQFQTNLSLGTILEQFNESVLKEQKNKRLKSSSIDVPKLKINSATGKTTLGTVVEEDDLSYYSDNDALENYSDDNNNENSFLKDLDEIEYAADIAAKRTIDIRNIIYLIENYYSVCGMSHAKARYEALSAVLSYHDSDYDIYTNGRSITSPSKGNSGGLSHESTNLINDDPDDPITKMKADNHAIIKQIIDKLHTWVGLQFQQQFSKYIRVVNVPKVSHVLNRLYDDTHNDKFKISLDQYISRSIEFAAAGKKSDPNIHPDEPYGLGDLFYDGTGVSMHSDNIVGRIFDQDRKFIIYHSDESDFGDDYEDSDEEDDDFFESDVMLNIFDDDD